MNTPQADPKSCFVVMPFGGVWDQYYTEVYKPAISEVALLPVRADDAFGAGSVLQDIVDMLLRASVVLADISEGNRNVHYELGLAHALGKPAILVAPKGLQLFFDVGQERMLTYDKESPFWGEQLKRAISRALAETLSHPESAIPTAFMHVKPSRVEVDEVTIRLRRIEERLAEIATNLHGEPLGLQSSLRGKMHSLPYAEAEAGRLLRAMSESEAIKALVFGGIPRAMAESAVATAKANADNQ